MTAESDEEESLTEATLIEPRSGPGGGAARLRRSERSKLGCHARGEPTGSCADAEPQMTAGRSRGSSRLARAAQAEAQDDEFTASLRADAEPRGRNPVLGIFVAVVVIILRWRLPSGFLLRRNSRRVSASWA